MRIVLASKSPRRKEILENLHIPFEVITCETDESTAEQNPSKMVEELALRKLQAVYNKLSKCENLADTLIISADTIVWATESILGKPHSKEEAEKMIQMLSGNTHTVFTGVAIFYNGTFVAAHESTKVTFSHVPQEVIEKYVQTEEPYDKAGGYAIQQWASAWIEKIDGDFFNVVGLPVQKLDQMVKNITGNYLTC